MTIDRRHVSAGSSSSNPKAAERLLEARIPAEAHRHRQAPLLWSGTAAGHAYSTIDRTRGPNNRAENSHLPLRKRQRMMQRFRSPGALQRFTNIFSAVRNLVVPSHPTRSAIAVHLHRLDAFAQRKMATAVTA
ncbi:transposase-like protein [Rhizobium fabae]|uniref:Transposase-like protein n=1 Tax=Rhizobium fabae TaxID=573179 RepID=A0A7W6FNN1_9HYPH|nr:transposase-like protein [Rhizobium fabae]